MASTDFPTTIEEVTPAWLTQVLRDSGDLSHGEVTGLEVELIGQGVGIMGLLHRVTPRYSDGATSAPVSLAISIRRLAINGRSMEVPSRYSPS